MSITSLLDKSKAFWKRYKKSRAATAGLIVVIFMVATALASPIISPYPPLKCGVGETFSPPSMDHLMGTDDLGRDVFSGVINGARVSLTVGFFAALTSTCIGIIVGTFSGYHGGIIDEILMRITAYFQVLPMFVFALLIAVIFGSSIWNVVFVIAILSWPGTARLVRAQFLSIKEMDFVESARVIGLGNLSIMFREILPNAMFPVIINTSLQIASAILLESGISFIGAGDPNQRSWGMMIYSGRMFIRSAWWMAFFPGISIFITSLSLNMVGDGLNDALNPRLKER